AAGQTEVLSYNGLADPNRPAFVGGENPNYGVGLLTSVAAAVTGLKVISGLGPAPAGEGRRTGPGAGGAAARHGGGQCLRREMVGDLLQPALRLRAGHRLWGPRQG